VTGRRSSTKYLLDEAQASGRAMKDMRAQLEMLRTEAANCSQMARLATDTAKRELFTKLAQHYGVLAAEVQKAIARSDKKSA
jgi:hypothetical protein